MTEDEGKKKERPGGAPKWMTTFADLMALLLVFFVLILSFSVIDAQKYKMISGSMKKALGVQRQLKETKTITGEEIISKKFPTIPLQVQMKIVREVKKKVKSGTVESEFDKTGLILRVKGDVAFESGKAAIRNEILTFLNNLGRIVEDKELLIKVSGHTDDVPLKEGGSYDTNWGLSAARAAAVVEYLERNFDIPSHRLSIQGYADTQPVASNDTPEGRARNRRVQFKIKPANPDVDLSGLEFKPGPADNKRNNN
ncbi:MAG: OmpA family protein [Desulfurivibrionaceae bacterium]